MFNYDAEKNIATITVTPYEFDIDDLVGTIQITLDNLLNRYYSEDIIENMDESDYRKLCNLVFEKAKYKENKA